MKLLVFIILLCSFFNLSAQGVLRQNLDLYYSSLIDEDYELVVELMHPRLFKEYPKELVVKQLSSMSTSVGKLSVKEYEILSIAQTYALRDTLYSAVKLKSVLVLPLAAERMNEAKSFESSFKKQYGAENVEYDETRGVFTLESVERMLAVSFNDGNQWCFIGNMDTPNAQKYIPSEVSDHFKP